MVGRMLRYGVAAVGVVALAAGMVLAAAVGGYPASRPRLLSGAAWLASAQVGQLALLDGSSAERAAQVVVAPPGNRIDVVQQGATAYVVNRTAGSLRRVDGATFEVSPAVTPIPDAAGALLAFAGPNGLYALDPRRGLLTAADPLSLATSGRVVSLASRVEATAAAVDEHGRLWVLDTATGDLAWLDARGRGVRRGAVTAGAGLLTLAGGAPVVVDTATRRADLLDPTTGGVRRSTVMDIRPGEQIAVSGSPHTDRLYVVAARGLLTSCALSRADCTNAIPLAADSTDLGAPVETGGRVFVPDYSSGRVWIVDLDGSRVIARPQILLPQTRFQLLTRDGLVFFNDPDSEHAGVIRLDGGFTPVAKYDPANPEPGPHHPAEGVGTVPSSEPTPPEPVAPNEPTPPADRPTVRIVLSNANPFVGDPVALQATGAPGKPRPTSARWDFGDGQAATGLTTTHRWGTARSYQVSVQATFPGGATDTASTTIRVVVRPVTRPVLTVQTPAGGTITGPNGISCPGSCSATFDPGQRISLTARPAPGNLHLAWGGACGGAAAGSVCALNMTTSRTVSATFGPPRLTVTAPTNGRITGPNGINCPGVCTATYSPGQSITLTAVPSAGFGIVSWGGNCRGNATTCALTMTANRTASVRFDTLKTLHIRSSQFEPNGGAGVAGPGGLFCEDDCTWTFQPGQRITLTAVDQGLQFLGWGGDCASRGTNPTCTLTMDRNRSITAAFDIP
jgi:PKD domain/Divergent InlB B-repeat domain